MRYNSIANAQKFITEQMAWAADNGYKDITIWSNGEELRAKIDSEDIASKFQDIDFERDGFFKAIIFRNGHRVEF